jgi:hypothetical protein
MTTTAAAPTRQSRSSLASMLGVPVLRLGAAALLTTNAAIHAHLWSTGYKTISTIGPLFLLDAVSASVLAAAVLLAPRRLLSLVAAAAALLELGTVAGLYLSTVHGMFGFVESSSASFYWESAVTEIIGTMVLAVLAAVTFRRLRRSQTGPRW